MNKLMDLNSEFADRRSPPEDQLHLAAAATANAAR